MNQKNEESFSLEENLRQRAYYEKYYEDLAAHANQMDKSGQHEVAELDRAEMENASRILGELVREKHAYDDQQNLIKSQEKTLGQEQPAQQSSQSTLTPETIREQAQPAQHQVEDIPEQERIKADKSHFTDEAFEAQARADAQLAAEEAAMDEKIKAFETEFNQGESMAEGTEVKPEASQQAMDSNPSSPRESANESLEKAEDQPYDYGYGM